MVREKPGNFIADWMATLNYNNMATSPFRFGKLCKSVSYCYFKTIIVFVEYIKLMLNRPVLGRNYRQSFVYCCHHVTSWLQDPLTEQVNWGKADHVPTKVNETIYTCTLDTWNILVL